MKWLCGVRRVRTRLLRLEGVGIKSVLLSAALLSFMSGCCSLTPLPQGVSYQGQACPAGDVRFLRDLTWVDAQGHRHLDQQIFDEVLAMIGKARRLVLLDMFLFNEFQGEVREASRPLSRQITRALIEQKGKHPQIQIVVITDPINTVYGGIQSGHLTELEQAGIPVTLTDLDKLRDSNCVYSSFWRLFVRPAGNDEVQLLTNPFGGEKVSARSYLRLLNFKANHRKLVIADEGDDFVGLVTSANPHDGSAAHQNVAVRFTGPAVRDLLDTELAVLAFSGGPSIDLEGWVFKDPDRSVGATLRVVTEGQIKKEILNGIRSTTRGDTIRLAVFYLSERLIIRELINARRRGVTVRVLLDPNKDAFGRVKDGVPNRPVAKELRDRHVDVRWCNTHGEQFHTKMMIIEHRNDTGWLILGSANYTRRNLNDLNLETDVVVRGPVDAEVFTDAIGYFDLIWDGGNDRSLSLDYEAYGENSFFKGVRYLIMEASGLGTF